MNINRYLVTLELTSDQSSLEYVKELPGLANLQVDEKFGVINISPKENLYVIRVSGELDPEQLMSNQPQVKAVHGDAKIGAMKP
jgi:hypothetical protein